MAECDVCHEEASKYKCPACGCRSCSSKCIQLHKDATPCSGQRNKAAYIPPNDYGYGALMDDYAYLEALSRNLEQVQKGPAHGKRPRKIELDWVKKARERHVTIILLQEGMERRKTNQTKWQDKASTMLFTLTFQFHFNGETIASLTTHQNAGTSSLADLLSKPLQDGRGAKSLSKDQLKAVKDALSSKTLVYLLPVLEDPRRAEYEIPEKKLAPAHPSLPVKPSFASLPIEVEPPRPKKRARTIPEFIEIEGQEMLIDQLKDSTIIEWPVIDVWPIQDLERAKQAGQLEVRSKPKALPRPTPAPPLPTESAPSIALVALGGYGSDSASDIEEEDAVARSLLTP